MKRADWQRAFGEVPEDFHLRLRSTLNGLEEKEMKKKRNLTLTLLAAALIVALLAGAGIAASKLGVFDMLKKTADPIVPLEGAQELVGTNLGSAENELARLTVEEAVFDGQGVLVQMRLTPRDEKHVLYNAFATDSPLVETKFVPLKIDEGVQEIWNWTVVNEKDDKRLLEGEVELEIPASVEEAQEKGLPIYMKDGVLYDSTAMAFEPAAPADGREVLNYWSAVRVEIEGLSEEEQPLLTETGSDEGQQDGSVIIRTSLFAEEPLNVESVRIHCSAQVSADEGEDLKLDKISITLPKRGETQRVRVEPVGDGKGERFEILPGEIIFTKVRGYFDLKYRYQQAQSGEEMGIDFRIYDADGNRINTGSGSGSEVDGLWSWNMEMQSFAEIPETIWLEAKVIGEEKTLGRVECRLIPE